MTILNDFIFVVISCFVSTAMIGYYFFSYDLSESTFCIFTPTRTNLSSRERKANEHFLSTSNVIILLTLFIVDYECDLSKNVKSTINNVLERHINTGTLFIVR
jgi:hypothetical protein